MVINIPEWGVVVGLLGFACSLAVVLGAIYSRIGKLEGLVSTKLNGAFSKLVSDVEKAEALAHTVAIEATRIKASGEETARLLHNVSANCIESTKDRYSLGQDLKDLKKDVSTIMGFWQSTQWDGSTERRLHG